MNNVIDLSARRTSKAPSATELKGWALTKRRLADWWRYRVMRKLPRLVWYGDQVQVRVRLTMNGLGTDLADAWRAEDALHKAGITFDTGTGASGRDWEWDWSLKGPIEVSFVDKK